MAENPFANLTAVVAELPTREHSDTQVNPFAQMLTDSFTSNTGRKVVLAAQHVAEAVKLIRRAANKSEIGARIVLMDSKGAKQDAAAAADWATKKSNAQITVLFQGQKRRAKSPNRKAGEVTVTNVADAATGPTDAATQVPDPAADAATPAADAAQGKTANVTPTA